MINFDSCIHHPKKDVEHFYQPRKFPFPLSSQLETAYQFSPWLYYFTLPPGPCGEFQVLHILFKVQWTKLETTPKALFY